MPRKLGFELPVVNVECVAGGRGDIRAAARRIEWACRDHGFFYAVGHGVLPQLPQRLASISRRVFALPPERKQAIAMTQAGRAWRGWFPLGGELTQGQPDYKEGLYFGEDHAPDDPRVLAGWPLHGSNLYPSEFPELAGAVSSYMASLGRLAQDVLSLIAIALGLPQGYFEQHYTARPTTLLRVFRYPAPPAGTTGVLGVGEHTDYGLLTIVAQDDVGGLQVRTESGWRDVPPIPGTFVCNIGDMLDKLTGGWFRSTPHRVWNRSSRERLSIPFFFDPDFDAEIHPLRTPVVSVAEDERRRWDGRSVHPWRGRYGDYLIDKVGHVFPELGSRVLPALAPAEHRELAVS